MTCSRVVRLVALTVAMSAVLVVPAQSLAYEGTPTVLLSMRGCASLAVPVDPVPVTRAWSRCDPARLGWAAEGSFFWTQQVWPPVVVSAAA